jgi:hypothetical protein
MLEGDPLAIGSLSSSLMSSDSVGLILSAHEK